MLWNPSCLNCRLSLTCAFYYNIIPPTLYTALYFPSLFYHLRFLTVKSILISTAFPFLPFPTLPFQSLLHATQNDLPSHHISIHFEPIVFISILMHVLKQFLRNHPPHHITSHHITICQLHSHSIRSPNHSRQWSSSRILSYPSLP